MVRVFRQESICRYMGFELKWLVIRIVSEESWKAYVTVQEHLGELYHSSSQWGFTLFALDEDIIMH